MPTKGYVVVNELYCKACELCVRMPIRCSGSRYGSADT